MGSVGRNHSAVFSFQSSARHRRAGRAGLWDLISEKNANSSQSSSVKAESVKVLSACSGDLLAMDVEVLHYRQYLVFTPLASEINS